MKPIQVGLLGIGTVGSGVFNVLRRNQEEIRRRAGRGIEITMVADLDVERAKSVVGAGVQVVNNARAIIANPDIDIVVELIGGYGVAKALVLEAIARLAAFLQKYRQRHGTDKLRSVANASSKAKAKEAKEQAA